MTEYDYYLTAVKEDGVSLFDVPYVYQTNELIMIALEVHRVHRDRYVGSLVYRESVDLSNMIFLLFTGCKVKVFINSLQYSK